MPPQKGERDLASGASYRVGYGRPPKQHQFQPGQSGNRKGRPKGTKNTATLLREILDRKIEVRTGTTVRKISVREAILTRFAESALKGDTKSAGFLLQRYNMLETARASEQRHALEDREIIDAYMKSYLKKRNSGNDEHSASISRRNTTEELQVVPSTMPDDAQPRITLFAELAHYRHRLSAGTHSPR